MSNQEKGTQVKPTERSAKSASTTKTGLFATLRALLHVRGSSAPSAGSSRKGLLALAAASLLLALAAASASAKEEHYFLETFGSAAQPTLGAPARMAVDPATGDLLVIDFSNQTVHRFKANGESDPFSALGTNVIDGKQGSGGNECATEPSSCDLTPQASLLGNGGLTIETAIAVAPPGAAGGTAGDIYVTDGSSGKVDVFSSSGEYLSQFFNAPGICSLAVDTAGDVYVGSYEVGAVLRFAPSANPTPPPPDTYTKTGEFPASLPCGVAAGTGPTAGFIFVAQLFGPFAKIDSEGAEEGQTDYTFGSGGSLFSEVAVDPSTGHVYAANGQTVTEYDASGASAANQVSEFELASSVQGLSVDPPTGNLYVTRSGANQVEVFSPLRQPPPAIEGESIEAVGVEEAIAKAKVNPKGFESTYHIEYGTDISYGQSTPDASLGSDETSHPVSVPLSGLEPGTTYHWRLVAENSGGSRSGQDQLFHTYRSPSTEPDSCPNAAARSDQHAGFLPDCRAYEMVSPPDKHGGDVLADSERTRAATDGSAVQFSSLGAFGDAIGTGVAIDYMALRSQSAAPGTNGWSTHAITPLQEALGLQRAAGGESRYVGDLSPDLERGVFSAWSPLTEDPYVAQAPNLYLRDDLRTPGAGNYSLLSACPLCEEEHAPLPAPISAELSPFYGGASADFSHVAFEQAANRTPDAPAQPADCAVHYYGCLPRAYESVAGQVRLAGLVPPGAETTCGGESEQACEAAEASILGWGIRGVTPIHVISNDGRGVFFTVPTDNSGNVAAGARVGRLYMRLDGTETFQLDVPNTGVSSAYAPAKYWGASADGKRVFFSTTQALTEAPGAGLYMWDAEKPAGERLTWINTDANDFQDMIGISEDGSYVYYQDGSGGKNVYMWHDGHLVLVGKLALDESTELSLAGSYNLNPLQARVSADGHLLFTSHSGTVSPLGYNQGACVTGAGGKGCRELYLYSPATESLTCVSCVPSAATATVDATGPVRENAGGSSSTFHRNRTLSTDGKRAFFSTADPLVPQDTNGVSDAYEWEAAGAGSCTESFPSYMPQDQGCLYLLSSGTSSAPSWFLEASPSGEDAFFVTRQPLLGWDTDSSYDLYDARVEGGFPEPPAVTAPCNGNDPCRGAAPQPPTPPGAGTPNFNGPENQTPHHGCPKGTRKIKSRGKTRCVKPHHHKRRRTNTNRRAGR